MSTVIKRNETSPGIVQFVASPPDTDRPLEFWCDEYQAQTIPLAYYPSSNPSAVRCVALLDESAGRRAEMQVATTLAPERGDGVALPEQPLRPAPLPTFVIRPQNYGRSVTWAIKRVDVEASGPYLNATRYWGTFGSEAGRVAGAHVWLQTRGDGLALMEVQISNAVRDPSDAAGERVDGDLYYEQVQMLLPDGYRAAALPNQPAAAQPGRGGRGRWVLDYQGYLGVQSRATLRFLLISDFYEGPRSAIAEVLNGQEWARTIGDLEASFGPCRFPVADPSAVRDSFRYKSLRGPAAAVQRARDAASRAISSPVRRYGMALYGDYEPAGVGGNQHISASTLFVNHPAWTYETALGYSNARRGRNSDAMYHPDTGAPLTVHDFAAASGGKQPWDVHATPGSFERADKKIPWPRDVGRPWNRGDCWYDDDVRGWEREDHSHTRRRTHSEEMLWWCHGFGSARDELRLIAEVHRFTVTPYAIQNDRSGGSGRAGSLPGLEARAKSHPGRGTGKGGRQWAWPAHAWAAQVAMEPENEAAREHLDRFWRVAAAIASPTGCTRERTRHNSWGYANPAPQIPAGSDLVVDQSFEVYHILTAAYAAAQQGVATGADVRDRILGQMLRSDIPRALPKWFAYADSSRVFDAIQWVGGDSGWSQILNVYGIAALCGRAREARTQAAKFLDRPADVDIFEEVWRRSSSTNGFDWWSHEAYTVQYGSVLAAAFREALDA